MTTYIDHHSLAMIQCCTAALELLSTQPDTDAICELRELLEYLFDVLDYTIHNRHFGSEGLDAIIEQCEHVCNQVKEFEEK